MKKNRDDFIQENSPCGGFLQSDSWINFQSDFGIKNHNISDKNFWSNILEYELPLVGKYFYVPRGPVTNQDIEQREIESLVGDLIELAKINKAGWIRIDNYNQKIEKILRDKGNKVFKAPHDMQPKQIFMIDIDKSEEEILAEMKPKTRYNINLAGKKGVKIKLIEKSKDGPKKIDKFLDLIEETGNRKGLVFHPREYYEKMLKNIADENLKLYVAVYKNKIIAGALLVIYGKIATYLHGASGSEDRNVMAPFLLQWEMIKEAKRMGASKYDFGGISVDEEDKSRQERWAGVTRFKRGFSKNAKPVEFSGSYDIVIYPIKYRIYRILQKIKNVL